MGRGFAFDDLPHVSKDIKDIKTSIGQLTTSYGSLRQIVTLQQQSQKRLMDVTGDLTKVMEVQTNLLTKAQTATQKITKTTDSSTASSKDFAKAIKDSVTEILKADEAAKKLVKSEKDMGHGFTAAGVPINEFNKRTALVGQTLKKLREEYGILQFELTNPETFDVYKELGGNKFELLAEFISGTREEISIFGFEAAKARKFMYGFLPPGTFRTLNKFSSVLQLVGGTIRRSTANTDENNNALGNTLKMFGKLTKQGKGTSPFKAFSTDYGLLETNVKKAQAALDANGEKIKEKEKELKAAGKTDAQIKKATAGLRGKKKSQQKKLDTATEKNETDFRGNRFKRGRDAFMKAMKENSKAMGGMGVLGQLGRLRGKKPLGIKSSIRGGFDRAIGVDPKLIKGTAEAQMARDEKIKELKGQGITADKNSTTKKKFDKEMKPFNESLEEALGKQKDARGEKLKKLNEKTGKFFTKSVGGSWNIIKFVFKSVAKYLLLGGMALLAIAVIATKILPTIIEHIGVVFEAIGVIWEVLAPVVQMVFDGLDRIVNGFIDGDLEEILLGIGQFAFGVLGTLFGLVLTLVTFVFGVAISFVTGLYTKAKDFILGGSHGWKSIFGRAFAIVAAILIGIKIATLLNSPAFIAVAIMAVLFMALKWALKKMDFFASGGVSAGGMALVGERGPEFVKLPSGSRVHSNKDSRKMVGGGSVTNNINVTINAKDTSKNEMRRIAKEIGNMINKEVNRGVSSSTTR